ncbi:MAG: DUF4330 domain-containing protein [Clostridia bacterium]|nr:DUF4330 domain-containing protein [Clostridia bacterium]
MKVIENKKLFGKINLMDVLILIVIFAVVAIGYKVVFKSKTTVNVGAKFFTTTCIMKIEDMPIGSTNYLNVGADVYDNETNVYIGKLIDFKSGDYNVIKANKETNEYVEVKIPNKENVYLTIEVDVSDQGADLVTSNNYYVKVGKYLSIRSSNFAGGGYMTFVDREAK